MKETAFPWSSQPVVHDETGLPGTAPLAIKALGVALKHFLIPLATTDIASWRVNDHYRHHLFELEETPGDGVWIKPWLIGEAVDGEEHLIRFSPDEFADDLFRESLLARLAHLFGGGHPSALFGLYLVVGRTEEGWRAVFGFRLDGGANAATLSDMPAREALCLELTGDPARVEAWLNQAYR